MIIAAAALAKCNISVSSTFEKSLNPRLSISPRIHPQNVSPAPVVSIVLTGITGENAELLSEKAMLPFFPHDKNISGILYCCLSFCTALFRFFSPVNHCISLSEILRISQCSNPNFIFSFASSILRHKFSRRFGSKEHNTSFFSAIAIDFFVAASQILFVIESDP